ncbi:hypothetical protein ACRPK8_09665 [Exiguobacterium sp. TDN 0502]|uniref:hypothetical protein n=1 Tax=Exiguobacterium sp. TDN 0502 TaxID=3420731 RepID=UPI003D78163F
MKLLLATTHVDSHGMRMSIEALEGAARQINGDTVPSMGVEHDVTIPPLGKFSEAFIHKLPDGEYGLFAIPNFYIEEDSTVVKLPNGEIGRMDVWRDKRPFVGMHKDVPEEIIFSYDLVNFESNTDSEKFSKTLKDHGPCKQQILVRKSLIPDPELIITLTKQGISTLIAYKFLNTFGKKVKEDLNNDLINLYSKIRNAMINYAKHCIPKNRPVTYLLVLPGVPSQEFVIKSLKPCVAIQAVSPEKISEALSESELFTSNFDTQKIQFIFCDDKQQWKFNYLVTNSGEVIGSKDAVQNREKAIKLMMSQKGKKM